MVNAAGPRMLESDSLRRPSIQASTDQEFNGRFSSIEARSSNDLNDPRKIQRASQQLPDSCNQVQFPQNAKQ